MRDFTLETYALLLDALIEAGYDFQTFRDYMLDPKQRVVILRHDVDKRPGNSLSFAKIEAERQLNASYYFRIVKESLEADKLLSIKGLGHEIGYHYEDMDTAKGVASLAIESFTQNLALIRKLAPIETICMHGSPLSKYDNKDLWKDYDYREYGIIGEPYFDLDYKEVFYVTDTGRKWNNADASIRDKVQSGFNIRIESSFHFIRLLKENKLPDKLMINTHPQRWDDNIVPWVRELVMQNVKNLAKRVLTQLRNKRS
ncbi:MAG TPA: hypothetical protein PL126_06390 [Candidatus Cloacimonadota bacterium]|nr:hypothetical protein [Candidatus Cloacimonadota bacterium]